MKYRRIYRPGGIFFFTLVTSNRIKYFASPENIALLGEGFRYIQKDHPFTMIAHVIMRDHLHAIWQLPDEDEDYSTRWRLLKSFVTREWKKTQMTQIAFWQNRFWEHTIRNQRDLEKHIDYIHYNPVKHGLVEDVAEWKHSSFNDFYDRGEYDQDWGKIEPKELYKGVTGE